MVVASKQLSQSLRSVLSFRAERRRAEPAYLLEQSTWDILLNLALSDAEARQVSVSEACIYCGMSRTAGLRRLAELEADGLISRNPHESDGRVLTVALSAKGTQFVHRVLAQEIELYRRL